MSNPETVTAIEVELDALTQVVESPRSPYGYGADLDGILSVTDPSALVNPLSDTAIAQAAVRRLVTPRGSLPGDPDYGKDLRQLLNSPILPAKLLQAQQEANVELVKDDRVLSAQVTIESNGQDAIWVRAIMTRADTGATFTLTANIAGVSAEVTAVV